MDLEIERIYAQNAGNIPRVLHIVYMEAESIIIIQSQTIYYLNGLNHEEMEDILYT